ncbi:Hsp20/alpha crystallin family protein [Congregibacter variabilis]|uniref:Hsp20/alpha crystallin family protein n=1 Tax=Congregibacter variabilis TaxID=3081200 RepID=A0ABZ0I0R5_9GAMM|nr:Hsp20/alpha crystallin family protein [Congregibacter sp. IMCC43200]
MNTVAVKDPAKKEKRGLRRWNDLESRPLDMFLWGKSNLHREMDRLFDDFLNNGGRPTLLAPWSETVLSPLVDETEDDKAYHIEVELPGIDQADIDVSYSDGLLTISGEKKEEKEEEKKDYYRKERAFGQFRRVLPMPGAVDESKIQATFKKGVLHIELPKTKEAQKKVKKISVKTT